jgi:hypothetical protein
MYPESKLLSRVPTLISLGCLTRKCSHIFSLSSFGLYFFSLIQILFVLSDDDKPKEATAIIPPSATSIALKKRPQEETIVDKPLQDFREKAVDAQPPRRQKKMTRTATISIEVHRPSSFSEHVSTIFYTQTLCFCAFVFLYGSAL